MSDDSKLLFGAIGDVHVASASMAEVEADETLPLDARMAARFARLVIPHMHEATKSIANDHGPVLMVENVGRWCGMAIASILLGSFPSGAPKIKRRIFDDVIKDFGEAMRLSLMEFDRREREGTLDEIHIKKH